jgi:hypothetical protein
MLTYRHEILTDKLIAEMEMMFDIYLEDVAAPFHAFPWNVDWFMYKDMASKDRLRIMAGRTEDGQLKAFSVAIIGPHPHYACIFATIPLFFLHPDFRKGMEGVRLRNVTEKLAADSGAQLILLHGGHHNNVAKLFEAGHFQDFGQYFVKVLPDGPLGTRPVYKTQRGV